MIFQAIIESEIINLRATIILNMLIFDILSNVIVIVFIMHKCNGKSDRFKDRYRDHATAKYLNETTLAKQRLPSK